MSAVTVLNLWAAKQQEIHKILFTGALKMLFHLKRLSIDFWAFLFFLLVRLRGIN
jgi:hypothetical protein